MVWRRSRVPTVTAKASILDDTRPATVADQLSPRVNDFIPAPGARSATVSRLLKKAATVAR